MSGKIVPTGRGSSEVLSLRRAHWRLNRGALPRMALLHIEVSPPVEASPPQDLAARFTESQ